MSTCDKDPKTRNSPCAVAPWWLGGPTHTPTPHAKETKRKRYIQTSFRRVTPVLNDNKHGFIKVTIPNKMLWEMVRKVEICDRNAG